MQADDTSSSFSSHQVPASDAGSDAGSGPEYARDVACRIILDGLGEELLVYIMQYQEDPPQMWKFLYERYSANTMFSKATLDSTLARMEFPSQLMHEYVAKWELCAVQMESIDG